MIDVICIVAVGFHLRFMVFVVFVVVRTLVIRGIRLQGHVQVQSEMFPLR